MSGVICMTGQRRGRLLVGSRVPSDATQEAVWQCQCDCGSTIEARGSWLRDGAVASCGCAKVSGLLAAITTHGLSFLPEIKIWRAMLHRCYVAKNPSFYRYGGRGITVCDAWRQDFPTFYWDMGIRPLGHSLDRVDNNGPYSPGNCRWADIWTQSRNKENSSRITAFGETKSIIEWASDPRCQVGRQGVFNRLKRGLSHQDAVSLPRGANLLLASA